MAEARSAFRTLVKEAPKDLQTRIHQLLDSLVFKDELNNTQNNLVLDTEGKYVSLTKTDTIRAVHTFSPSFATAPFRLSGTAQQQLVTGFNSDYLDGQHGSFYQDASNINAGTLAVSYGGTGLNTLASGRIPYGAGTSAFGSSATFVYTSSSLGIGTTGPDRTLDVLHASDPQVRLTQADGTVYVDLKADSSGNLNVLPSGTTVTLGGGTAGVDYILQFNGETNDGVITWMEDEDRFQVSDDVNLLDDEKLILGTGLDGNIYASSDDLYIENDTQDKDIIFKVNDGGVDTEVMRVRGSTGALGINNTAPDYKLTVDQPAGTYGIYFRTTANGSNPVFALASEPTNGAAFDNPYFVARHKNSAGTVQEDARLYFSMQDVTAGSEDCDIVFHLRGAGAIGEKFRFKGETGRMGVGTSAPDKQLEINSATGACLRLTYNDSNGSAANYTDFAVSSGGDLTITASGGDVRIGDSTPTNYTNFDSTGHQTMVGTAKPWEDLRIEPVARTTGTGSPTFEKWYDDAAGTSRGVFLYSFTDESVLGNEKEVFFSMQMPHAWDGGPISMHVHWVGAVDDTTSAPRWGLEYAWKDIGEVFGDTTIIYSDGVNYVTGGTDANITAGKHYLSEFADITPGTTADGLSSILVARLFRNSSDAGDTYDAVGAKVGLLYVDAHYQLNSLGSTDEYTK